MDRSVFARIAAKWEDRPHRLEDVTDQVAEIHGKLVDWGLSPEDEDGLDHATICFSKVVASYECVGWLPFDLVPNWETDLFCVLMDEERWCEYRENGWDVEKLAAMIRGGSQ